MKTNQQNLMSPPQYLAADAVLSQDQLQQLAHRPGEGFDPRRYLNLASWPEVQDLIPRIGASFQDDPQLLAVVEQLNNWQYQTAFEELATRLAAVAPSSPLAIQCHRLVGETLIHLGDYLEMVRQFQAVQAQLAGDPQALTMLVALALQLGDADRAASYLSQLQDQVPQVYQRLAQVLSLVATYQTQYDLETALPLPAAVDAIALYGHRFEADGQMSNELQARLTKTLALAERYPESQIMVSGGAALSPVLEADEMARWLTERGIQEARIHLDRQARDTVGNVIGFTELLSQLGSKSVVAVTSQPHLPRAWLALVARIEAAGLPCQVYAASPEAPGSVSQTPAEAEYILLTVLRAAGLFEYRDFI